MSDRKTEYVSLGIEAIPSGLVGHYRSDERMSTTSPRYRLPQNVLRVEGLVAIAMYWMKGRPKSH